MSMGIELGKCDKCGDPVYEGQARYGALEPPKYRHAACHDFRKPSEICRDMRDKIKDLKSTLNRIRN